MREQRIRGCKKDTICYCDDIKHHCNETKGFTLAEVLITLGVIGIVAALTMPVLITKYQKKQAAIAVKKVYSEFSQAIKLAELDYGLLEDWPLYPSTLDSNREFVNTYISPYYKGLHIISEGIDSTWKHGINGTCINAITSNGTIISSIYTVRTIYVLVDINGYKKPNVYGRDIFYFHTDRGKLVPSGWQDGLTREMILNGYRLNGLTYSCKKKKNNVDDDYTDHRHACTALLMIDGWVFKDDYPW